MNWPLKRLDELGAVGRGKSRHRPRNDPALYGGPYPFIQTAEVKHADLYITAYEQTYSEAGLAQSKLWPVGTLCITIAANIAETSILGIDACFPDSVVGFIADPKKSDTRFVKYAFDVAKTRFQQISPGAAQDNLSLEKLFSLKMPIPEKVDDQRRIADVLSAYDELIETNRRRMGLLEEAARLLYREWFVRLRHPACAKATAGKPGHPRTGLPAAWQRKPLDEVAPDVRETVDPSGIDADTPYIGLEHMPRRSITLDTWGTAEDVTSTKLQFRAGEILFGKIRPYFHKVGFALLDGVTSSDAIVLRPVATELKALVLLTVSSDAFVAEASQSAREGSKMPRADWKLMARYPVLVPPPDVLGEFNGTIEPILEQLRTLAFQNRQLRAARDLLLPRLMSGRIAV